LVNKNDQEMKERQMKVYKHWNETLPIQNINYRFRRNTCTQW